MDQWNDEQKHLLEIWQKHLYSEFALKDVDMALSTMTDDPYVLCVAVGRGGYGKAGVRRFYAEEFFTGMPADTQMTTVAQTIAADTLVEETVIVFDHDVKMQWMLPNVEPTGRRIELPMAAVIGFRDGLIHSERLYWDQATLLVQLGLLDPAAAPGACGAEAAALLRDPSKLGR